MRNLKEWIEEYCKENHEEPLKATIGGFGWSYTWGEDGYLSEKYPFIPWEKRGIPLDWAKAKQLLDYEFDEGFGAAECHAIYVWTNKNVLFIVQYDGSTNLCGVPRRPKKCHPEMPGG